MCFNRQGFVRAFLRCQLSHLVLVEGAIPDKQVVNHGIKERIISDVSTNRLRDAPGGEDLRGLSMGMSGDFEIAIEEGATQVRVGTALFGARKERT